MPYKYFLLLFSLDDNLYYYALEILSLSLLDIESYENKYILIGRSEIQQGTGASFKF